MADFDVAVIGAGVSGVATLKCVLEVGLSAVCFEKTDHVGGLWHFTEDGYGVMRFTHINVSKYNYCFSDFPFPDDVVDHPHNTDMQRYIESYVQHFDLSKHIQLNTSVISVRRDGDLWRIQSQNAANPSSTSTLLVKNVAVATGHHALPIMPSFPGQETFSGQILHSVAYKDVISNGLAGKKALVVGVGNSGMDVVVDLFSRGGCKPALLSTRSGAWVASNHIFGYAIDLYACRLYLWLPWRLGSFIFEQVLKMTTGNPYAFNLNPTMKALQTQPSVSGTMFYHLRRKNIIVKPDIERIAGSEVFFKDGTSAEVEAIVCCTGYKIHLPFLDEATRKEVLIDETNELSLYKNVFSPKIGPSLAFVGFVQPASGGILSMSETQARWFAQLCYERGRKTSLPSETAMLEDIQRDRRMMRDRYTKSTRHTIQRDPLIYNDEVASMFGAKPQLWRHPLLAFRLIAGSAGSAQWRLQGPVRWVGAEAAVRKVPMTPMMAATLLLVLAVFLWLLCRLLSLVF